MLILALDSSATASAAVVRDERVLASFASVETNTHAEVLAPGIARILAEAGVAGTGLDAIVVGVGPGPFTGLRAGIMTARALAFGWSVPVHGMMSLDGIAAAAALDAWRRGVDEFLVATDARRKEVYWARYRSTGGSPELVDGPQVGAPARLPALPVYGAGAGLYPELLDGVEGFTGLQPDAAALAAGALVRLRRGVPLADTAPLYLRDSDAKVPGPRKRAL